MKGLGSDNVYFLPSLLFALWDSMMDVLVRRFGPQCEVPRDAAQNEGAEDDDDASADQTSIHLH